MKKDIGMPAATIAVGPPAQPNRPAATAEPAKNVASVARLPQVSISTAASP